MEPTPTDAPATANAEPRTDPDRFEVTLEVRGSDGPYAGLVRVQTWQWLPWLVALTAIAVWFGIELNSSGGLAAVRFEFWVGGVFVLVLAAAVFHKLGALKQHYNKFVFSNPDDIVGFARFDDAGLRFGVPKLHDTFHAWVSFTKYAVKGKQLTLSAPLLTIRVDISLATEPQHAQIMAGLARAFSRPRVGPPIYIPHCMACGYDLSASPGPDCPECGKPFHRYNYRDTRATDN